jgi:hypothetical protein
LHSGVIALGRFAQEVAWLASQDSLLDAVEHLSTVPLLLGLARLTTADDGVVGMVERALRLERGCFDVAEIAQSLHQLDPALIARVVLLHHADH